MRKEVRDDETWFIAETDRDKMGLTAIAHVLATSKINHSVIYTGEPGQENPVVEELSY